STDVAKDSSEVTIEPVHEALLRQWGLLQGWLREETGLLGALEEVKRAARDWAANDKGHAWLMHTGVRFGVVDRLAERPDLAAILKPTDREYLAACYRAHATTEALTFPWMMITLVLAMTFFGQRDLSRWATWVPFAPLLVWFLWAFWRLRRRLRRNTRWLGV